MRHLSIGLLLLVATINGHAQVGDERRFTSRDRERAEAAETVGSRLLDGFRRVEAVLDEQGWDRSRIVDEELAWAAVVSPDGTTLVGLYERTADTATRLQVWSNQAGETTIPPDLQVAEWVLVALPQDCSKSYGVLLHQGDDDVYALRLTPRDKVPIATHYLFTVADGRLADAKALSETCKASVIDIGAVTEYAHFFGYYDMNAAVDFPTAVHVFLSAYYKDQPYKFTVLTPRGRFTLRDGRIERSYFPH